MNNPDVVITVTVVSLTLLIFIVVFLLLLSSNANRKNRHRAEISDIKLNTQSEVMQAEREATQTTMANIGQELHDNVGQLLAAAHLGFMHRFETQVVEDEQLGAILSALDEGIAEVSRLGRSLNTDIWEERTLFESINASAAQIERLGKGVVHIKQYGNEPTLSAEEKVILFRAYQEVLSNTIKHARAKQISIRLQEKPLSIELHDDGIGFNEEAVTSGMGLKSIRKRCSYVNVSVSLNSIVGEGSTWTFYRNENDS